MCEVDYQNIPQFFENLRQGFRENCCNANDLFLESKFNDTESLKSEYSGRELMELIQNADDAYSQYLKSHSDAPKKASMKIEYNGEWLAVYNKGIPFNADTIRRLCIGGVSVKKNVIGCKGKGFRSLLNFSENIFIYSGDFAFCYTRENADAELELIKENPIVQRALENKPELTYPILLSPAAVDQIDKNNWDTIIKLKLFDTSEVRDNVKEQIDEFDCVTLLFLPTVSSLDIMKDDVEIEYKKKEQKEANLYSVLRLENGEKKDEKSYYFFEEKKNVVWNETTKIYDDCNESDKEILHNAVAIPIREENFRDTKNVYSYFAIREEKSPFPAVLHSTFLLNEHRDSIVEKEKSDSKNKSIAQSLLKFYVETVKENFLTQKFGDYAMLLLTPNGFNIDANGQADVCNSFLKAMNLLNEYVELLKPLTFFFTINKEFICNNPEYIDEKIEQIPESFTDPEFNNLIPPIQENRKQFVLPFLIKYFELRILSANDICKKINTIAQNLDSPHRMKIFHWWKTKFKENVDIKPVIVKTTQGDLIGDVDKCYLTGGSITTIPQWASITVIDKEDENNLLKLYETEIRTNVTHPSQKRILASLTGLREQSNLEQVVNDVNESVKDGKKAKEFIGWLYGVYQNMPDDSKNKLCSNDSLVVPVQNDSGFCKKNKAYIAYGNSVGGEICQTLGLNPLVAFNLLQQSGFDDEKTALNFFEKLRIVKYPKPRQIKFEGLPKCIDQFLKEKVTKPDNCKEWMKSVWKTSEKKYFDSLKKNSQQCDSHVLSVENIEKINLLPTKTILKWLLNDEDFYKAIDSDIDKDANLFYKLEKAQKAGVGACKPIEDHIPNFLRYYLSTEKWIDIDGAKQNIVSTTKDSIESQSWYRELIAEDNGNKLPQLLQKLGLKVNNFSLSPEDFYNMLLDWGDKEIHSREAVKLYSNIADPKNRASLTDKMENSCKSKEQFKQNGYVWAVNREGEAKFVRARDTYFTSSAVLNFENRFLIKTPARVGQYEVFEDIFGVKKYEEKIIIKTKSESQYNQKFQKDFKEFLPYFVSLRSNITTDVIKKARDLKIILLDSAKIDVNGHEQNLERMDYAANGDFPVLQESASSWYVVIGSSEYHQNGEILQALKTIFYVAFNHPSDEYLDICENLFAIGENQRQKKLKEKNVSDEDFNDVRNRLDNTIDYKSIFEKFSNKLNQDAKNVIDSIQFEDINCTGNIPKFQELIELSNLSVQEFNNKLGLNLSFVKLNHNRLESAFGKMESVVRRFYVKKLKDESIEEKMELDSYVENARKMILKDIPNTIPFDENEELKSKLEELDIKNLTMDSDPEKTYKNNVEELRKKLKEDGNDSFDNNLLYFEIDWSNEEDPLANKLLELFNKPNAAPEEIEFGQIQRLDGAEYVGVINASSHKRSTSTGSPAGGGTYQGDKSPKLSLADSAEYEVYEQIREKKIPKIEELAGNYEPEHVNWCSGAAHRMFKTRGNDKLGYDIKINGKNCDLLIEVKSSTDLGCSFFMSSNEMNIACTKENYVIIFVGGVASEKPQIQFIGNPFFRKTMTLSDKNSPFASSIEKYRIDYHGAEEPS